MVPSPERQIGHPDLGELLPMAGLPPVVLPALELEHVDLGLLAFAHDFGLDLGPAYERRAGPNSVSIRREEDLVEGDLVPRLCRHQREPKRLALLGAVLLAERTEDCVHDHPCAVSKSSD